MQRSTRSCQANSFIAYRLTGAVTQDICQSYGFHCFNMRTGQWDMDMCDELGIPRHFLPKIVPCHQVVEPLPKKQRYRLVWSAAFPWWQAVWMQPAGHWEPVSFMRARPRSRAGQAGGMSICMDSYTADPRLILGYHVVPANGAAGRKHRRRGCDEMDGTGIWRL